jgi:hypothetical protein
MLETVLFLLFLLFGTCLARYIDRSFRSKFKQPERTRDNKELQSDTKLPWLTRVTKWMPCKVWLLVRGSIYIGLAIFFSYVFYIRYWKYRDCIEQAISSCITPEGGNLTQGGAMWSVFAVSFLLAALCVFFQFFYRKT